MGVVGVRRMIPIVGFRGATVFGTSWWGMGHGVWGMVWGGHEGIVFGRGELVRVESTEGSS